MFSVKIPFFLFIDDLLILFAGILSCLWFIGWAFCAYSSPSEHPRISYAEKLYLLESVPKPRKVNRNEQISLFCDTLNISDFDFG
jgi:hypothetical protein